MSATLLTFSANFNSHARVGRDDITMIFSMMMKISTHTPAWGVTVWQFGIGSHIIISTHTPAWGVTTPKNVSRGKM